MIKLRKIMESESYSGDEVIDKFIALLPNYGLELHTWSVGDRDVAFKWRGGTYPTITDKERSVKVALDRTDIYGHNGDVWMGSTSQPLVNGYVIQAIVTDPAQRGKGKAKEMLRQVLRCADEAGLLLKLEPVPMKDFVKKGQASLTKKQLQQWYGRHGFQKDPEVNIMTRPPAKLAEDEVVKKEKEAFRLEREGKITYHESWTDADTFRIALKTTEGSNARGYVVLKTRLEELESDPRPRAKYLIVNHIVVDPRGEGYGFLLYKRALIYAQKIGYLGLVSEKGARSGFADDMWAKLKTSSDKYYDYVDIKDLGTRIKERKLTEGKKYDMNKVEDAAEYMIRLVWKAMPDDEKFNDYYVHLWMDNEEPLQRQKEKFANQFFPNDPDPIESFSNVISDKVEELEKAKQERLLQKINVLDPLFVLKKVVRGKTYEGAKQSLFSNTVGAWGSRGGKVPDAVAENLFNRLYKNAMGETVFDEARVNFYGRLSDFHRKPIVGRPQDNLDPYAHNLFIDFYAGHNKDRFPPKVKVYRGVNRPDAKVRAGDYVTFDKHYAAAYMRGKFASIIHDILDSKDLYVYKTEPDQSELVYWPAGHQIKKYEGHIPTFAEFWKEVNER